MPRPKKSKQEAPKHVEHPNWRVVFPSDDNGGKNPRRREYVIETIEEAMRLAYDPVSMAVLPGNFLVHLAEHDLPRLSAAVGERLAWRAEQSFSRPRSQLEKETR